MTDGRKFTSEDIKQTSKDKCICDEGGCTEFCKVSDEGQWQEDDQLNEDKEWDGEISCAMSDRRNNCLWKWVMQVQCRLMEKANLKVLRDKDGVGCDKSNLRDCDGKKNRISHPWSVQRATDV